MERKDASMNTSYGSQHPLLSLLSNGILLAFNQWQHFDLIELFLKTTLLWLQLFFLRNTIPAGSRCKKLGSIN